MNNRFNIRYFNKNSKKFEYLKIGAVNFNLFTDWTVYEQGQFCTGLKDKNGKLIYEGDIVKFKTELFGKPKQIIWDECHYILKDTFIILCDMEIKQFGLEVIGNIYENKELLESEG